MHPLLLPYAFMGLLVTLSARLKTADERLLIRFAAWSAMALVVFAVVFREINGDTYRYYATFLNLQNLSFQQFVRQTDGNWLFIYIIWILGNVGSSPFVFILPITLFCVIMMSISLRCILSRHMAAVCIFIYSMYPFFVMYIASGIKQAIAMALLLQAYVSFFRNSKRAWIWLLLAPLFHSGALLVFPFIILHIMIYNGYIGRPRAIIFSLVLFSASIALSIMGLNEMVVSPVKKVVEYQEKYAIYFIDAKDLDYKSGFRIDFTAFSMVPIILAWWLWFNNYPLSLKVSGWWLNLYILLSVIYQLFSFAPYADRFAGFAWFILPVVSVIMIVESGARHMMTLFFVIMVAINLFLLQTYTGRVLTMGM